MHVFLFLLTFSVSTSATAAQTFGFTLDPSPNFSFLSKFKGSELCKTAENTNAYINKFPNDSVAVHGGNVFNENVNLPRVRETLIFICDVYRDDVRSGRQSRLHDAAFVKEHFDFYRWAPDKKTANFIASKSSNQKKSSLLVNIPSDKILLTKYYTKLLDASVKKTAKFDQALYALPHDEEGLSIEQAESRRTLTRFKYTRQHIIEGVLEREELATPLVWLSEAALHDVLLQGTGVLNDEGRLRYFNVHRNNGIAYDYAKGKRAQARYWYFAEVPSVMGYGKTLESKIAVSPQVTFAGNVKQLGLGKLFLVKYHANNQSIARFGVLADQGGAFDNNLFQLDLLVDSYWGWKDYYQANKHIPDYAAAWLVLKK